MRRYLMSIIDFSEIKNITTDEKRLNESKRQMQEEGLLTEKGNPSNAQINNLVKQETERILYKLSRRIPKRFGGIKSVYDTFCMLEQRKEYTAMYFYLAFLYGFVEWRVPIKIELISSNYDALKIFFTEFLVAFKAVMVEWKNKDSGDKE